MIGDMRKRERQRTGGRLARLRCPVTWLIVGVWVAWSLAWVAMAVGGGPWYAIDIGLAYQAQALGLGAALLVWCAAWRQWRAAAVVAVSVAVGAGPMVVGRSPMTPGVDLGSPPADGTVRIVSANIDPENERWREDLEQIFAWHPDVVVLIETSPDFWRRVVRDGELLGTEWVNHERRFWVDEITSPCSVLSRWALERIDYPEIPDADRDVLIARVEHPAGTFLVGAIHPHSPRTLDRWRRGNDQMRTTADAIGRVLSANDESLVMGTDLNSGPAGWRAGLLRRSGLGMSKPLTGGSGSFPAGATALLRVQLDDVWCSAGVVVRAWSSPGGLSSDHRAVVVDVSLTE